jgi:hypothetical protein
MTPEEQTRVTESARRLVQAAAQLNARSNELGQIINTFNQNMQGINLGIEAWVPVPTKSVPFSNVTYHVGYARMRTHWGLALRESSSDGHTIVWAFNDGPRWLRLVAIDLLGDVVQALGDEAERLHAAITQKLKDYTASVAPPPDKKE